MGSEAPRRGTKPGAWENITIRTGNIDTGANDELVTGVRYADSADHPDGLVLDMSIIDIRSDNPRVVAQSNFNSTAVLRAGAGVQCWTFITFEAGLNAPTFSSQRHLIAPDGAWIIVEGTVLPPDSPAIPPTQF